MAVVTMLLYIINQADKNEENLQIVIAIFTRVVQLFNFLSEFEVIEITIVDSVLIITRKSDNRIIL